MLTIITVWLLISEPTRLDPSHPVAPATIAQFADAKECDRVLGVILEGAPAAKLRCIRAQVVR